MKKKNALLLNLAAGLWLGGSGVFAASALTMQSMPALLSADYLSIKMPNGAPNMGLFGLKYDVNALPIQDLYSGLGVYSAIGGNQGGVFILGVDNDYRPEIAGPLYLNAGVFLGGGGSAASQPFGGGFMVMPYAGLSLQFKPVAFNLGWSYVKFPDGQVASSQVLFGVSAPLDFNYFDAGNVGDQSLSYGDFSLPYGAEENSWYLSPVVQVYHVKSSSTSGLDPNLYLVGAEAGRYFTNPFYVALRTMGVAHGNANGYMEVMVGPGYEIPLFGSDFAWDSDVMIGAGGGGSINTGNGLQGEIDTGLAWHLTPAFTPKAMFGYLASPNGQFKTWVGTLGFNYDLNLLASGSQGNALSTHSYEVHEWRILAQDQTLFDPSRTTGSGNLSFLNVSLDQFLNQSFYLSYRTSFPIVGNYPNGGNSVIGQVGVGGQLFSNSRFNPFATILIGAIGGGGINAGGGLMVEPEIGLHFSATPELGLDASVGQMKSFQGDLNSTVVNAGLSLSFGEAQATRS